MVPSGVRRACPLLVGVALAFTGRASADDGRDPRDAFGIPKRAAAPPVDCRDGAPIECARATDPLDDSVPFAEATYLSAAYLRSLPVGDAHHDDVAHYTLAGTRDGAGAAFAGGNGLENRWTVDGAPIDSARTGGAELSIPLAFLDGIAVTVGGFAARDRTSTGAMIDARLIRGGDRTRVDAQVWASWTAQPAYPPIADNTFELRRGDLKPGPTVSASLVASGPLPWWRDLHAWYATGVAPRLAWNTFEFTAARLVDADGNSLPDGYPGQLVLDPIEHTSVTRLSYDVPAMLRAGVESGPHQLDITLLTDVAHGSRYLYDATLQASGVDRLTAIGDAIATWSARWANTRARVQLAWHRSVRTDSAADPHAADQPQLLTAYVPAVLNDDPQLAAGCVDPDPSKFTQCPITTGWFASGGAGPLTRATTDRPSLTADLAHRVGNNVVRVGTTAEDTSLTLDTHYTGGAQLRSLFPGYVSTRRFLDPNIACTLDLSVPCATVDHEVLSYRTLYAAAYAEDTWRPEPNIAIDGGLRGELMWVGPVLHFSNELAPRLGAMWDPRGGGRSRIWVSMGRSFAMLPAGMGTTILARDRTVDDVTSAFGTSRIIQTGAPVTVASGIQPIAQDEITLGAEVSLAPLARARLTLWLDGRWLARGIETTPDGLDNPGRSGNAGATDLASRETQLVGIELATDVVAKLVLRVGYTYGRTVGTWTGAYDPNQGAILYAGNDFDVTSANQLGHLPSELGHHLYVEAVRRGRIADVPVAVSTRLTVASSPPRDVLGAGDVGLIYLLPRGQDGGPLQTAANVRLATRIAGVDVTLDGFDVFDRRDPTDIDQVYAGGSLHPIDGGTPADLVFLTTDSGKPATRSTGYHLPTAFGGPLTIMLGARAGF